jgi:hypothetical protein
MTSFDRLGYADGAYCSLPPFVYDAKIEDEYGNANQFDTHINRVEELRRNGI